MKETVVIHIREYGGAYIARAAGYGKTASCTSSAKYAAEAVAKKVFGKRVFELKEVTSSSFIAEGEGA